MTIRKITSDEVKSIKGDTDWDEVDKLTDEEIEKAAKSDPDSALPTDEELKGFKRLKNIEESKDGNG